MYIYKKNAFTLAEVLITLGIIGVVAALTMPALIANYRKQEIITRLKRQYSALTQALKLAEADYGDIETWEFPKLTESDIFMNKYIVPYLQVTKNCGAGTGGVCWAPSKIILGLDGSVSENFATNAYKSMLKLNDGTNFAISGNSADNNNPDRCLIYIDINGDKPPGKYGIDTFIMSLNKTAMDDASGTSIPSPGLHMYGEGLSRSTMLNNCSKSGNGAYCGALYQADGWQISDDVKW